MSLRPAPSVAHLISELEKLPGLGPLSAQRAAYWLLKGGGDRMMPLARALSEASERVGHCPLCNTFTEGGLCELCADESRDRSVLCVVESVADQQALENSLAWPGLYFVLSGRLNPIEGNGPKEIGLVQLIERIEQEAETLKEVVVATSYTPEGDATAYYLIDVLQKRCPALRVTRLARGLPTGIEIKYTDLNTIANAVFARRDAAGGQGE